MRCSTLLSCLMFCFLFSFGNLHVQAQSDEGGPDPWVLLLTDPIAGTMVELDGLMATGMSFDEYSVFIELGFGVTATPIDNDPDVLGIILPVWSIVEIMLDNPTNTSPLSFDGILRRSRVPWPPIIWIDGIDLDATFDE